MSPDALPHRHPVPGDADVARAGDSGRSHRVLSVVLLILAVGMATVSLVGPLGAGWLQYRTSSTTLNQLLGSDGAALTVIAPLTVIAALLCVRGHRAGPVLGSGVGVFALYTYAQVIIGQEYLRLPGNIEYWFPLLLTVFILAEAAVVLSWRAIPPDLPRPGQRMERVAAIVLLLVAVFLVFGLHLPTLLTAWQDPETLTEYASSPTPFWLVKLMDLGIIVPAAVATGGGLFARARWARRVTYPLLTGYTCLAVSVAAMAVMMSINADPDAPLALTGGFLAFAVVFVLLTVALYRPLFHPERHSSGGPSPADFERASSPRGRHPFRRNTPAHFPDHSAHGAP